MIPHERDEPNAVTWESAAEGPLPNRITRHTLTGCLGLLCVLALPALLFLPVEQWHLPQWAVRSVPLLGLAIVVLGVWLVGRVPAGAQPQPQSQPQPLAGDALHPLTSAGRPPVLERPATSANRIGLLIAGCLALACVLGYVLVSADSPHGRAVLAGTLLAAAAGFALLAYGALAAMRRAPAPALRWVRTPLYGAIATQAAPAALIGFVTLVWALFVAAGEGYLWAPAGVGLMILSWALGGSIARRMPVWGWTEPDGQEGPQSRRNSREQGR